MELNSDKFQSPPPQEVQRADHGAQVEAQPERRAGAPPGVQQRPGAGGQEEDADEGALGQPEEEGALQELRRLPRRRLQDLRLLQGHGQVCRSVPVGV